MQQEAREQHIVSAAVDAQMRAELLEMARETDRSLSSVVRMALRRYLIEQAANDKEGANGPIPRT